MDQMEPARCQPRGGTIPIHCELAISSAATQKDSQDLVLAMFDNTMEVPESSLPEDNTD